MTNKRTGRGRGWRGEGIRSRAFAAWRCPTSESSGRGARGFVAPWRSADRLRDCHGAGAPSSGALCGLGEDFGEVEGAGGVVLGDLLAAAEAVADDDGFGFAADSGKEDAFGQCLRDLVLVLLEGEGAGHDAAA